MKVSLDLHDWSVLRSRMDLLLKLREHYPSFRVSLFTIPYDYEYETSDQRLFREDALALIHANLDWMQLIPHGLFHLPREFENVPYYDMRDLVFAAIDEQLTKDELPYEHGFCAPYWLWNEDVVRALDERGWWGAIDRNQPTMIAPKRFYRYSHSIDEPFWLDKDAETLKLHGHMTRPSTNNLEDCLLNLLKLPSDVEWHYVTDFLEDRP